MAALFPPSHVANLLSLPARQFAVVDAGSQRVRILVASISRGQPRLERTLVVDSFEEGATSPDEIHAQVRQHLEEIGPEAVLLIAPQHQVLHQVLDSAPADAAHTRALLEREASSIGGLSESRWTFDSSRLRPFGRVAHPLAASFCRQDHLQELIECWTQDESSVFEIRAASDALAAAFRAAAPRQRDAILVDLGAQHTALTVLLDGQPVFAASFPSGSAAFSQAIATDRGCSPESAEVLKRTESLPATPDGSPAYHASLTAWVAELERTLREWRDDHPDLSEAAAKWSVHLAGGGALQPDLPALLSRFGARPFLPWPASGPDRPALQPDFVCAWGAVLLVLTPSAAPSFLPPPQRSFWVRQRFWRFLLLANFGLAGILGLLLFSAYRHQTRVLDLKRQWKDTANRALNHAREIRIVSEGFNDRMDALRPILEAERQTVETLQVLAVLQNRRTNAQHWYVLLSDALSYGAGSNNFAPLPTPRPPEARFATPSPTPSTNAPPPARAFIAEICLVPQGEEMRQSLSQLIGDLKQFPLFRNVDILSAERRRSLVGTNLIFPERHFALELNLSESELLPLLPLPKPAVTNREPTRSSFRVAPRPESVATTNVPTPGRPR